MSNGDARMLVSLVLLVKLPIVPGAGAYPDVKVAVDVGHTSSAPGATSARGVPEYEFNRRMASAIVQALREDGGSDSFVIDLEGGSNDLASRTALAKERGADLFLSIHHDSVQPRYLDSWLNDGARRLFSDRYRGFSLFVSEQNHNAEASLTLAQILGDELLQAGLAPSLHHTEPIPGEGRPLLDERRGIHRFDDLTVLRTADMPAVLLECGVIVHRNEERVLASDGFRTAVAEAVRRAVRKFASRGESPTR